MRLNFFVIPQELDIESETIVLADAKEDVAPNDLSKHVPADKGRYIFYLFKHTFEGDYLESVGERKLPFQGCGLAQPANTTASHLSQPLQQYLLGVIRGSCIIL